MRYIYCLILCFCPMLVGAQTWEDRSVFGASNPARTLRVLSSTDTSFFAPIIESFLQRQPGLAVEYFVISTAQIDEIFRAEPSEYDVVISSAMDLQLKLVNDGYGLPIANLSVPDWAQWRDSLYAFTSEPATVVVNRSAFPNGDVPRTRQELIQALRARPELFDGRVGTYDVRLSGLGYLFATQDARASESFWRLMEVIGGLNAKLYCCSGEMIEDLETGKLLVAYNVLGSYVDARETVSDQLEVILPSDFPTTMMRTAFVHVDTMLRGDAEAFVRHLVNVQSALPSPETFPLPRLTSNTDASGQSAITLEPALMTYLDPLKRRTFIKEWSDAVIQ
ncbi:ABC transporter substrate-binding protein [Shimia sp. R9_1]|uniref:ABC transporter substrate-binding protein n=1 Tax=unclassified Shimia TaxID=2630038 RepID=UPI001ADA19AD|nr:MULTISPECIES: ABC transporter substrate-binding protein [unclassified Shimia]MBO9395618.1 ABC transporter substrate-binding protein [Shimia sp. R9_2]MBO9407622.1 ABC transporter substrate-binding protein [Shimia sp. R9_1]